MNVLRIVSSASRLPAIVQCKNSSSSYAKKKLKDYVLPQIDAKDCEQKYISGWGPGGSKVNSARNAVMLRHIETNCVVKVHDSRILRENIDIAFKRLKLAVDKHLNGDNCYEMQFKRYEKEYEVNARKVKNRRRKMLEQVKKGDSDE